jgi:hypothetical protein
MKRRQFTSLPLLVLLLTLTSTVLASTTWYVDGSSGNDANNCMSSETPCKTIGHAISLAASGDSIMLAAATYGENLTIATSLNVIGSGASTTIIDGGHRGRVVTVSGAAVHVTLSNVTITNGLAQSGGGIASSGTLTIVASAISGNTASPSTGCFLTCAAGGGIYNSGTLTINDSTVSGNTAIATLGGGGHFATGVTGGGIENGGTLVINNSTIAGNSARKNAVVCSAGCGSNYAYGGGIYTCCGGALRINNSTIADNSDSSLGFGGPATFAGGDIFSGTPVTVQNTIVAGSSSGGNCYGAPTSNGYNLSSDNTCSFSGPGDLNNTDPKLGTLGYYGGPTQTIPLLPGSPAIDAGNPSGCKDGQGNLLKTDQRGMPRPDPGDSGGCDIGAYESQSD